MRGAVVDPVGDVAFGREVAQCKDADARGDGRKVGGHGLGMVAAGVVIVGDDDDIEAGEISIVFAAPLTRASGVGGREQSPLAEAIGVFLAFDNKNARRGAVRLTFSRGNAVEVVRD